MFIRLLILLFLKNDQNQKAHILNRLYRGKSLTLKEVMRDRFRFVKYMGCNLVPYKVKNSAYTDYYLNTVYNEKKDSEAAELSDNLNLGRLEVERGGRVHIKAFFFFSRFLSFPS
jgi:hypothetical protein